MYRKLASALLVASAINAKYAFALGLGGITMHSALNQPLDAEISLSNVAGLDKTQIMVTLASPEDFQKAGVDRTFFLSDIKFDVTLDGKGGGVVKLRSQKRLNEPYLDFLIEAKWPTGRMLRSYTALVDLPVYADEQASQVEAVSAQPVSAASAPVVEPAPFRQTVPSAAAVVPASKPVAKPSVPKAQAMPKHVAVESSFAGEGYKIKPNQTLSQIARELRPAGDLSVNQTMLAIQKLNPHAFIRNNVNLIKAGAVLRIPTAADVRQMTAAVASREIERQTLEWRGAQLDATDASRVPVAGAPAPEAEEARLSLTSAGSGLASGKDKAGAGAIGTSQGTATKDGVDAATLKKELDAKRENLKRMIEVKDAELAALQKNLGKDAAAVGEAAKKTAEAEPKEAESTPAQPSLTAEAEAVKETDVKETAEQPKTEPKKPQPKKVAPAPAPEELAEPGILDVIKANALYIGIVALVLMFGVVAVIFRRKAQADRQAMADNDIANFDFDKAIDFESAAAAEAHEIADEFESHAVEEVTGAEEPVADEQSTVVQTSDPIGEAEIYIAYGRYDQAADLLSNAIVVDPDNVELRSKLLEVYLEARNKAGFQQQFIALRGLGQAAAISHAKELLTSVDGVSDWLDDLPSDEVAVSTATEEDEFASLLSDVDLAEDDIEVAGVEGGLSDFSFDELESPLKPDPEEEEVALDLSDDFSFAGESAEEEVADLSLDFAESESDLSSELDASFVSAPVSEAADVELDLGDLSFDLPEDFGAEPVAEEALPELEPVSAEESLALDDFDFGLKEEAAPEEPAPESEELSLEGFDLDLGLGEPSPESESEEAEVADLEEAVVEDTLDFSDVDLGLDVGLASVESEPSDTVAGLVEDTVTESPISEAEFEFGDLAEMPDMAEPEFVEAEAPAYEAVTEVAPVVAEVSAQPQEAHVSAPITTLESEDLEFLTDGDEVSTKLDLAQAYVDLGDIDGARDILLEVMKEGRDEQKAEAAALLDSLD